MLCFGNAKPKHIPIVAFPVEQKSAASFVFAGPVTAHQKIKLLFSSTCFHNNSHNVKPNKHRKSAQSKQQFSQGV